MIIQLSKTVQLNHVPRYAVTRAEIKREMAES